MGRFIRADDEGSVVLEVVVLGGRTVGAIAVRRDLHHGRRGSEVRGHLGSSRSGESLCDGADRRAGTCASNHGCPTGSPGCAAITGDASRHVCWRMPAPWLPCERDRQSCGVSATTWPVCSDRLVH